MSNAIAAALKAYARTEPAIHAWVEVNPRTPLCDGPLSGVPFGVKDVFETAGLATEYGSPIYAGRKGNADAAVVSLLRKAGAILFGKTHTAGFAYFDPPPTRNPRNTAHTPGGSSSGSAAAVAAGVVPFALGTQTMGSILRPASFCGVVGFKPTYGALPREGVLLFAPSFDTVGLLAESVPMCIRVWEALGYSTAAEPPRRFGMPEDLPPVSEEMQAALRRATDLLRESYTVDRIPLPLPYDDLLRAARIINDYEGARTHRERWKQFGDHIGSKLAELVLRGMRISEAQHSEALQFLHEAKPAMQSLFREYPVLLTPAAPGPAPAGPASTGDPVMNAGWTAIGTPALSIPIPCKSGLPLGLQVVAAPGADAILLSAALQIECFFKLQVQLPN